MFTKGKFKMNERTRQLYIQAINDTKHDPADDINIQIAEKFAELIVQECIEQVITGPNGPAHYAVEAAIRLKKHFGVEL